MKLFYGDTLILENGAEKTEKTVHGVLGKRVLFEGEDTVYLGGEQGSDGNGADEYSVYLKKDSGVYEAEWENGAMLIFNITKLRKHNKIKFILVELLELLV